MNALLSQEQGIEIAKLKSTLKTFHSLDEIVNVLQARFKDFAFHALKDIPHPQELLHNMQASFMVCESILKNEKIVIVGDYDADGICATCIMLDFFESLAYPYITFAMPNRFIHGYGFSKKLLDEILQYHPDVKLIITVDNGVSSFEAGEICRQKGIKFIITDHHTLEVTDQGEVKIPSCDFLINPQQKECAFPYKDICGSLVAWYFCCAIKITLQKICQDPHSILEICKNQDLHISYKHIKNRTNLYISNLSSIRMESFLLLVGIAIISDVMPLNAINHTICKYALKNFNKSKRCAFQILMEYLRCDIDSQALGFRLIPLLNAAGRIDDGKIALHFLRSKTLTEARQYFKKLKELNTKRKYLQEDVTQKAFESISHFRQNSSMICAVGDDWHEGVLGIVAGKMADEFQKPCFALTNINGVCKGSGRSYGDIDLISSMQKIGYLTNRYGGHVGAVGLEIPYLNVQSFIDSFEAITHPLTKLDNVLGILDKDLISQDLFQYIHFFEPYGNGNPMPKFFIELSIFDYKKTGQGFLEFQLQLSNNETLKAMFFNPKYADFEFCMGDILQFRATLSLDIQSQFYPSTHIASTSDVTSAITTNPIMLIIDKIYGLQRTNL